MLCEFTIYPYLPVVFLTCAVLLNINKWLYCLMHINFYSKASTIPNAANEGTVIQANLRRLSVKKQLLNLVTIALIVIYLFYNFSLFIYGCAHTFETEDDWFDHVYKHLEIFTQVVFTLLAVLFIVTGIILIRKLKQHFKRFYEEFRKLMLTATILLTVPLTFRALLDGIKLVFPSIMVWVDGNLTRNAVYNFIFFLLTTYVPIMGQIMSLVFGYVRHR